MSIWKVRHPSPRSYSRGHPTKATGGGADALCLFVSACDNPPTCEKRKAQINWFMVIIEKAAPVTGTTLRTTGTIPADSQQ